MTDRLEVALDRAILRLCHLRKRCADIPEHELGNPAVLRELATFTREATHSLDPFFATIADMASFPGNLSLISDALGLHLEIQEKASEIENEADNGFAAIRSDLQKIMKGESV